MNTFKLYFFPLIVYFILPTTYSIAQQSYLHKILHDAGQPALPPNTFFARHIKINNAKEVSLIAGPGNYPDISTGSLGVFKLSEAGEFISAQQLYTPPIHLQGARDHKVKGDNHLIAVRGAPSTPSNLLLFANFEAGLRWAKLISSNNPDHDPRAAFMGEDAVLTSYGSIGETQGGNIIGDIGLVKFKIADGSQEWCYKYSPQGSYIKEDIGIQSIAQGENGEAIVQGGLQLNDTIAHKYLLKVAADGAPIKSVITGSVITKTASIASFIFREASNDDMGNIYISGLVLRDTSFLLCSNGSGNRLYSGFVAKLNPELEVEWCKELIAENFAAGIINMSVSPVGEVVFAAASVCDLPVITGKLSPDGELQWVRGYEFFQPDIDVAADGSISFLSLQEYLPDGSLETGVLVARVPPDGELPSCPQFDACLRAEDMALPIEPLSWEHTPGPVLEDVEVLGATTSFEPVPHCSTPPVPSAFFELPDTLCAGSGASPDTLQNRNAHAALWEIEGPGQDTAFDSREFDYCFDEPGMYLVRHTVWLLGCTESYEQVVEVLPPLDVSLGGDMVLCEEPPVAVSPLAGRPLTQFSWQDGSQAEHIMVDSSGLYYLTASDGYCEASDTARLTLLRDTVALPAFSLSSEDTTVCQQHLPNPYIIDTPYELPFELNGELLSDNTFELDEAGTYTLHTELLGCPLSDSIALAVSDCAALLYLPTAFSPNGDGRNDLYRPLGKFFEPVRLEVYGRWGGLLYQSEVSTIEWDGTDGESSLPVGHYVVVLHYINTRTGLEEQVEQGVNLLR